MFILYHQKVKIRGGKNYVKFICLKLYSNNLLLLEKDALESSECNLNRDKKNIL